MCIRIRQSFVTTDHIKAYKTVRCYQGRFFSRYMPNYRIPQDEWVAGKRGLEAYGADTEYKLGEVMHDMGNGYYVYSDLASANYNCRSEAYAVFEVLIPRGTQCLSGSASGYDAYIAKEIIVLKQITKGEMENVYGPY